MPSSRDHPAYIQSTASAPRILLDASLERRLQLPNDVADRIEAVTSKVKELARAANPVWLYSDLKVYDMVRRSTVGSEKSFGSEAALEFFAEVLLATEPETVRSNLRYGNPTWLVFVIDQLLRQLANDEHYRFLRESLSAPRTASTERVVSELELEKRFDRFRGYRPYLRHVFDAITRPLEETSEQQLGYPFHAAWDLALNQLEFVDQLGQSAVETPNLLLMEADDPEEVLSDHELWGDLFSEARPPVQSSVDLCSSSKPFYLTRAATSALIEDLSVSLGSDRAGTSFGEFGAVSKRAVIKVSEDQYFWPHPSHFFNIGLEWVRDICASNRSLLNQYNQSRQVQSERLVVEALQGVFGATRTFQGLICRDLPGGPDIDVLLVLPGDVGVVVEVKGGLLTDSARRAAPGRVKKKLEELVHKPVAQNLRAQHYLADGGFLHDRKKRQVAVSVKQILPIVAVLERIDPFYSFVAHSEAEDEREVPWFVNIMDLMLVCDVLKRPSELIAYVETRLRINRARGPIVVEEAAALEEWCARRIEPKGGGRTLIANADMINSYFASLGLNDESETGRLPSAGLPGAVQRELGRLYDADAPDWAQIAIETLAVPPSRWGSFNRGISELTDGTRKKSREARKRIAALQQGMTLGSRIRIVATVGDSGLKVSISRRDD